MTNTESDLFYNEIDRLSVTNDPYHFCSTTLHDVLFYTWQNRGISMYDQQWNKTADSSFGGIYQGPNDMYIWARPNKPDAMRQTLRHEGAHAAGVSAVDSPNDGTNVSGLSRTSSQYKQNIMSGNPMTYNGEHAGEYCLFYEQKSGAIY